MGVVPYDINDTYVPTHSQGVRERIRSVRRGCPSQGARAVLDDTGGASRDIGGGRPRRVADGLHTAACLSRRPVLDVGFRRVPGLRGAQDTTSILALTVFPSYPGYRNQDKKHPLTWGNRLSWLSWLSWLPCAIENMEGRKSQYAGYM